MSDERPSRENPLPETTDPTSPTPGETELDDQELDQVAGGRGTVSPGDIVITKRTDKSSP